MMYTSFLKGEERVTSMMQTQYSDMICEAMCVGEIRGRLRGKAMDTDSAATSGTMTITKHLYNEARPYNSTVAFEGGIDSAWRNT